MIDEVDDKVLVITFTNGLQSKEFLFSIYKNDPEDDSSRQKDSKKTQLGMRSPTNEQKNAEEPHLEK